MDSLPRRVGNNVINRAVCCSQRLHYADGVFRIADHTTQPHVVASRPNRWQSPAVNTASASQTLVWWWWLGYWIAIVLRFSRQLVRTYLEAGVCWTLNRKYRFIRNGMFCMRWMESRQSSLHWVCRGRVLWAIKWECVIDYWFDGYWRGNSP